MSITRGGQLDWLSAKVKVLDTASGRCFESAICPEKIETDTYCGFTNTTMHFSPVTLPEVEDWNAKWEDGTEKHARRVMCVGWFDNIPKKIIFSGPCTIILWNDGSKTIARVSDGEDFDPEKGVAVCFMKKIMGHTETNKLLRKAHDQYLKDGQKR
jgi:hypothetical protein